MPLRSLCLTGFRVLLILIIPLHVSWCKEEAPPPTPVCISLSRGEFPIYPYPAQGEAKAVVLFASGDGGWKPWENRVAAAWAAQGYVVLGWDCKAYAKKAYEAGQLVQDMQTVLMWDVQPKVLPRLLAGYSTGAEQVAAVGASPDWMVPVPGLLLIAPGERGRYGITMSDLMGMTPKGAKSFAMKDWAPGLNGKRLAQIQGEHDPLDSTVLYEAFSGAKKIWIYPDGWHRFDDAGPKFQQMSLQALQWVLDGGKSSQ